MQMLRWMVWTAKSSPLNHGDEVIAAFIAREGLFIQYEFWTLGGSLCDSEPEIAFQGRKHKAKSLLEGLAGLRFHIAGENWRLLDFGILFLCLLLYF